MIPAGNQGRREEGGRAVRVHPTASATLAIYFMNANPCVHSGLLCFTHTHIKNECSVCVRVCGSFRFFIFIFIHIAVFIHAQLKLNLKLN